MKGLLAILLLFFVAVRASGHEVRPAYLELTERGPGDFDVVWKVPAAGGAPLAGEEMAHPSPAAAPAAASGPQKTMPCGCPVPTPEELSRGGLPIHPLLPGGGEMAAPPRVERIFGAEIKRWSIHAGPQGLEGREIGVHGLEATMVDVLVRVALADGRVVSHMLRPDAPAFVFHGADAGPAAGGYFTLGVEHILFGIDHLLFVLALVLIVRGKRQLLKTITAFTIAHSITLALATLGWAKVPPAPVEAVIALSIVFVAAEILRSRRGQRGLTERAPWLVAGSFGLLHGFGFAGALSEVGLPANDIPLALLFFNLGVEAGQLAFVIGVLAVIALLRRARLPQWAAVLPPYAIGSAAMFWVIERSAAMW
ncbi:HupE/UreJ family protein [Haloferula sp. BvORR071]|uniref:HupE/UreJ family protein n=1 Tax=Haloferula sp. BvORR071 TaxID=1396141 RepID=UPI00054F9840|nr:HupE/UreJ family protein [Haloferula sp. BvORR071]